MSIEPIEAIRDLQTRNRILACVRRLVEGNPGQHRYLGKGVFELKIDIGPGYRLYYARTASQGHVLLLGGDKRSQGRDIWKAIELSRQYREEHI